MSVFQGQRGPDYQEERPRLKENMQPNKIMYVVLNPKVRLHSLGLYKYIHLF